MSEQRDEASTTLDPGTRSQRLLDLAQRLCQRGYPHLTEPRRGKLWDQLESFLTECLKRGATGWENGGPGDYPPCDLFRDAFEEFDVPPHAIDQDRENRFYSLLQVIARTSFDAVDGFPGGVVGWTVGDVRRIYEGTIPDWWNNHLQDRAGNSVDLNQAEDHVVFWI